MNLKIKVFSLLVFMVVFLGSFPLNLSAQNDKPLVYTVTVEKTVTAGTYQHINRTINMAEKYNANALIIQINTPGGLVNSTLDIIKDISGTDVPVITYVTPRGGIAASAGTFILISGHVAVMTPGTTCGAAMPVTISSGESPQAADQKTINFLASHMKTIAQDRGKSGDVAARFVSENLSLNAEEALEQNIIDFTAPELESLLMQLDGLQVMVNNELVTLSTKDAQVVNVDKNMEEKVINVISEPTMAVILLMLGIYGLIIGFNSPGFLFPEILGSICLILGLLGMGSFEINLAAGLLLLLGVGLLIAEAFSPTYGALAAGGVVSIVLGILFIPVEPMMPSEWFANFKIMALGIGVVGAGLVTIMLVGIWRIRKHNPVHGAEEFINQIGIVIEDLKPYGQIRLKSEIWNAITEDQTYVSKGEKVEVVARQALVLVVKHKGNKE